MRNSLVVPFIIMAAIILGGILYLYGSAAFRPGMTKIQPAQSGTKSNSHFTVLAQGNNAAGIDQKVNYLITNSDQLEALWTMVYSTTGPTIPKVDFDTKEVLAAFDGSHSSGGYGIMVTDVKEKEGKRVISITHTEPGDSCMPPEDPTSPFVLIIVSKSPLPVDHDEITKTVECQ